MRKIATILLLIVFCNGFFYYTYFSFSIIKAKIEAAHAIANWNGEATFIKVPTAALQKDESDEAWYNNKLYDVAKRESVNDTAYVYLVRDEEEQDVLIDNSDYFKNDPGLFLGSGYKANVQKKMPDLANNNYLITTEKKLFFYSYSFKSPTVNYTFCFKSICADVTTPPPKQS